jgi:hypothetical protein
MNEYGILNNFSLESDFWEENEHFLIYPEFKEFHRRDKSRGKKNSSQMMWAIALLVHPKSKFKDGSYQDRVDLITDDYLDVKYDWVEKYEELIEKFKQVGMTRIQRIAMEWGDKLDERMIFLTSLPYNLETVDQLDKAMANTGKIWDIYQKCLADLNEEESKGHVQGGGEESASEQNLI